MIVSFHCTRVQPKPWNRPAWSYRYHLCRPRRRSFSVCASRHLMDSNRGWTRFPWFLPWTRPRISRRQIKLLPWTIIPSLCAYLLWEPWCQWKAELTQRSLPLTRVQLSFVPALVVSWRRQKPRGQRKKVTSSYCFEKVCKFLNYNSFIIYCCWYSSI